MIVITRKEGESVQITAPDGSIVTVKLRAIRLFRSQTINRVLTDANDGSIVTVARKPYEIPARKSAYIGIASPEGWNVRRAEQKINLAIAALAHGHPSDTIIIKRKEGQCVEITAPDGSTVTVGLQSISRRNTASIAFVTPEGWIVTRVGPAGS